MQPKPASTATIAAQKAVAQSLPTDDGTDAAFAAQSFNATLADPIIRDDKGTTVWDLNACQWMDGPAKTATSALATVNPSLWRHQAILRKSGLFKLSDNMWQVRGFDVSNMTVIGGKTGWILIDPLTTRETGAAALSLANKNWASGLSARLFIRTAIATISAARAA